MTGPAISNPLLVISYNPDIRASLLNNLQRNNVTGTECSSFLEAEDIAREGQYSGILVDLQSILKAKGDEKVIACSLTGFFPTLRVRAMGSMIVPMAMPGDARQDGNLCDFLAKRCAVFPARKLRRYRRRAVTVPLAGEGSIAGERFFTLNISWGGAYIVDVRPEKYESGQQVELTLPEYGYTFSASVRHVSSWGGRRTPGFGVVFNDIDERFEAILLEILKQDKNNDRDRMIAR